MSSPRATSVLGPGDDTAWHQINWAACHRRVRSLQRRIVQAVQAGAWRKVKRLSYLLVHSFAARALAVKRVTENTGKKTPGVDGELWETPEKKATAVTRIGQWRGYRPQPLKRLYIPKKNGKQRPLSIPDHGRSGTASPLSPGTAADRRDPGGPELLRVSAQAPVRGCHRPVLQGPAADSTAPPGSWKGTSKAFSTTSLLRGSKHTSP